MVESDIAAEGSTLVLPCVTFLPYLPHLPLFPITTALLRTWQDGVIDMGKDLR